MAKFKKTKQQKIIAQLHRKLQLQSRLISKPHENIEKEVLENIVEKDLVSKHANTSIQTKTLPIAPESVAYVYKDLMKTAILTSAVTLSQLAFFFLLKKHILILPMINY